MPQTMFDKIWEAHEVGGEGSGLLYIDLHLVHEVTSPQAFDGLRLAGRARSPPRPHARDRRPQHAHRRHARGGADQGRALARAGADARAQLRGVRDPRLLARLLAPGDRPRDRPRARRHPARHDDRLRRLAHLHPRGLRRACLRDRHERGRARARDAVHGPAQAALDARQLRGRARLRRERQGPHPRHARAPRRGRHDRSRRRVRRPGDPGALDGGPHDGLQHDDRGRRQGRHDRPRRDHLRLVRRHRAPRCAPRGRSRSCGRGVVRARQRRGRLLRQRDRDRCERDIARR